MNPRLGNTVLENVSVAVCSLFLIQLNCQLYFDLVCFFVGLFVFVLQTFGLLVSLLQLRLQLVKFSSGGQKRSLQNESSDSAF